MTAQPVKTPPITLAGIDVRNIVLAEGLKGGVAVAVVSILFAIAGLSSSFSWVPEVPLLAAGVVVPTAILGVTGFRAGARTQTVLAGILAGAIAGALGGFVGGVSYVVFGKPALNIGVGLLAGAVVGAAIGAGGALLSRRFTSSEAEGGQISRDSARHLPPPSR